MPTPARTPSGRHRPQARFAHASADRPNQVSDRVAPGGPLVELPAEDLADLALPLEEDSSARRNQLHVAGLIDVADGAREVFEVAAAPPHHALVVELILEGQLAAAWAARQRACMVA